MPWPGDDCFVPNFRGGVGKGRGKGFNEVCHMFFVVEKQDKRVSGSVYQGFDTVGAEEGVCVCVVGIYFCEK